MRTRITIIIGLVLLGSHLHAQDWERIGWEGGSFGVTSQIDDIMFAKGQYAYYRSSDLGKSWSAIRDGLPLTIFAYDGSLSKFNDRLYLYAYSLQSKFEFGTGMYSIGKNDTSWTYRDIKPLKGRKVHAPPSTLFYGSDTILAFSRKGWHDHDSVQGIFLSLNNGSVWEPRTIGLPDSIIGFYPYVLRKRILLSVSSGDTSSVVNEHYYSEDVGATWERINNFPPIPQHEELKVVNDSILFVRKGNPLLPDSIITLYRSTTSGDTWDEVTLTANHEPRTYSTGRQIHMFGSKMYLYLGGSVDRIEIENGDTIHYSESKSYLYISTDKGAHWQYTSMSDSTNHYSINLGNERAIVVEYHNSTYTTDSSFAVFEKLGSKGIYSEYRTLYHTSGTSLFASEGTYEDPGQYDNIDTIYYSTNNGDTWGKRPFIEGYTLFGHRWIQAGKNVYALGHDTSNWKTCVFQSQDSGYSWKVVSYSPYKNNQAGLYGFEDTLLMSYYYPGNDTNMFISIDAGKTWKDIAKPVDDYSLFAPKYNAGILSCLYEYEFDKYILYYSTNLGKEWRQCNFPYTSFANGPFVIGKRWFVITNEDTKSEYFPEIFYSDDNGSNWIRAYGIPANMVLRQIYSDNGILYTIGNSMPHAPGAEGRSALFFSLDSGRSWQRTHDQFLTSDRLFFGSNYVYVTGIHELLRMPRSFTEVGDNNVIHLSHTLSTYPSPASDQMRIRFSLERQGDVQITVFDMMGRQVAMPADKAMDIGDHEVLWDTRNIPSGGYVIELIAGGERTTKVVTVLR